MSSPILPESPDAESMDAVRDLLFGKKGVEIDERFKSLERDMISAIQRIEDRLERKVDALDQTVQRDVSKLDQRITRETKERKKKVKGVEEMVEAYRLVTKKRFLEEENSRRLNDNRLSKNLGAQSARLSREIKSSAAALKKRILSEIESVRDEHLDLEEMGKLLVGLGRKLDPTQAPRLTSEPTKKNESPRVPLAR